MKHLRSFLLVVLLAFALPALAADPDAPGGPTRTHAADPGELTPVTNCDLAAAYNGHSLYFNTLCWWDHVIDWVE